MEASGQARRGTTTDAAADAAHAARSGAAQLLSIAGQALVPVYSVLCARLYGPLAFGVYQASLAVLDVLARVGLVGGIGAQHLFIARHRAAGERDLEQRALGSGLRLAAAASAALALALGLGAGWVARASQDPRLGTTLPIMAPAILFSAVVNILVAAAFGAKVARVSLYVRGIAEPAFLLGACVAGWALGGGLRALAAAYVVAGGLTAATAVVACVRIFGARRLRASLSSPRHPTYLRFALPLTISDVMSAVLQRTDVILITRFAGTDAVGVYAAAEFVARVVSNARYVFDPIASPILSEALHARDDHRLRYNLQLMTRWVMAAAAPITATLIVLRVPLLALYGPTFTAGAPCLAILAVSSFGSATLGLAPWVLLMGGRSRLMLVHQMGAALVNLAVGLILIPRFGITGAAIAVLVSVNAMQISLTVLAWRIERVSPLAPALLKPLLATAAAAAVELGVSLLPLGAGAQIGAVIAAGAIAYAGTLVALGLPPEEREIARSVVRRVRAIGSR